jgi:O-succinylhomoserine sulfhydrylase
MAAYSTMAALLNQAIISFRQQCFWGNPFIVCELFPKWNIETTYFDINNPDIIESCIKPNTKILLPNHLQPSG